MTKIIKALPYALPFQFEKPSWLRACESITNAEFLVLKSPTLKPPLVRIAPIP